MRIGQDQERVSIRGCELRVDGLFMRFPLGFGGASLLAPFWGPPD